MRIPPLELMHDESISLYEELQVQNDRRIPFTVELIDADRNVFDDFSSLNVEWLSGNEVS